MDLEFIPKSPDCAYIADRLWLPKRHVYVPAVKNALEFRAMSGSVYSKIRLWAESPGHLVVPREFIPVRDYSRYPFQFIDLSPTFTKVQFQDKVTLRNEEQEMAWEAFSKNDRGILHLGCGKGKTVISVKKIASMGVPALVIVPDSTILAQWRETVLGNEALGKRPCISFDGGLGLIQGPVFDWAHPITLALVTTLWQRIESGAVPPEVLRWFGVVVFDECHRIGAPKFSLTASPFYGDRIGLTATPAREDGLQAIYMYNLGEIFYSDLSQDLIPRVVMQRTPIKLDFDKARVESGNVNVSKLRTMLAHQEDSNIYRYWGIKEAVDAGRKILCLSYSKAQLRLLSAMFPGSAVLTEEVPAEERLPLVRNSNLCFAIAKLGVEGVDDARLDTLFWLTPFRAPSVLQQSLGRIQRAHPNKKEPLAVVFDDVQIPNFQSLCNAIRAGLREKGIPFETLKPQQYPRTVPREVKALYDSASALLLGVEEQEEED